MALDRAATDPEFRIFLVLLPGLPERFDATGLSPFLRMRTWVDFRSGLDDERALRSLISAVNGLPIGSEVPDTDTGACPYRGLEVFEEEHADFFVGRDADIQRLLEKLKDGRFLAVLGASGSGKSSLVRAGVIPALRRRGERIVVLRPGAHPLEALTAQLVRAGGGAMHGTLDSLAADSRTLHLAATLALADAPAGCRVFVVVDQFEEVFSLCRDDVERRAFFANLLYAATVPGGETGVVLTMRADFYTRCGAYDELAQQMSAAQYLVGPLGPEGLRQVIEQPARRAGVAFEPGLIATILDDVAREPGALPLLEHALLEVWRRRSGGLMTLAGYQASGGVHGAIAKRADEVLASLRPDGRELARQTFLRLTQPGEGTEDTRRRAQLTEFGGIEVIGRLVDARLLTTSRDDAGGEEVVEVAHEALIRSWPRLRAWIDQDRAGLRVQRRLTEAAYEWERLGREQDQLLRGARLAEAREWQDRNPTVSLSVLESAFLVASEASERDELQTERRRVRRFRALSAGLGVLTLLAIMLSVLALDSRRAAIKQQDVASSRQLAVQSDLLAPSNPVLATLLSLAAYRTAETVEARSALLHRLDNTRGVRRFFSIGSPVKAVAFSPDGRSAATGLKDGRVIIWEVGSGRRHAVLPGPRSSDNSVQAVDSLAFSPDGSLLATGYGSAGKNSYAGDRVVLWAPSRGRAVATLDRSAWSVAFSPDGRTLATADTGNLTLWDVASRRARRTLTGGVNFAPDVVFSPDGRIVASASNEGRLTLWSAASGKRLAVLARNVQAFAPRVVFSPDGRLLALANEQNVELWDVRSRRRAGRIRVLDPQSIVFGQDARTLAVASGDGRVELWDAIARKPRARYQLHTQPVNGLAFASDGRTLASAGEDGMVILWDLGVRSTVPSQGTAIVNVAVAPDGRTIALGVAPASGTDDDAKVVLWTGGERTATLPTGGDEIEGLAFSPDSRTVAAGGEHNRHVTLWDSHTGATRARLNVGCCHVESLAFSHDGRTLAVANLEDGVWLWDAITHRRGRRLDSEPRAVAFSDRSVAAGGGYAGDQGQVLVWDPKTGRPQAKLGTGTEVYDIAFSPDGRTLASGEEDGTVVVWDLTSRRRVVTFNGTGTLVGSVEFSPGGRLLLSTDAMGTSTVWDVRDRVRLGTLFGSTEAVSAVAFTPHGSLVLGFPDGRLVTQSLGPTDWRTHLCGLVGRDLGGRERDQYLPPRRRQERLCS